MRGTEPVSALTVTVVVTDQRAFSGDLELTGFYLLTSTVLEHSKTRSRAWGQDWATCAGLAHGHDFSDCGAF